MSDGRTIEWAVDLFRPLLVDLHIQRLSDPIAIDAAAYPLMRRYHMDKCIVVVVRYRFTKRGRMGVFCWQYDEETDLFALYIILDDTMFIDNDESHAIERKIATTHEYTHCVAAILSVSRLSTTLLIDRQREKLANKFHSLDKLDIKDIMVDNLLSSSGVDIRRERIFDDSHFRTGDEDFPDDYSRLYRHLLFSYSLFIQYYSEDKLFSLIDAVIEKDTKRADALFPDVDKALACIAKEKHLDVRFVSAQFSNDILLYAIKKHIG